MSGLQTAPGLWAPHLAEGRSMALCINAGKQGKQHLLIRLRVYGLGCMIKVLQQVATVVFTLDFRA